MTLKLLIWLRFISELISTNEEGRLIQQKVNHLDQKDLGPQQSFKSKFFWCLEFCKHQKTELAL